VFTRSSIPTDNRSKLPAYHAHAEAFAEAGTHRLTRSDHRNHSRVPCAFDGGADVHRRRSSGRRSRTRDLESDFDDGKAGRRRRR